MDDPARAAAEESEVLQTTPSRAVERVSGWSRTFAAFAYPNFRLWFIGQVVSLFGTWMQSAAQQYLVYKLTGSVAYLGLVGFASGLPAWFFSLYGGVIADRFSRRRLMIMTQSAMMLLALILAGLAYTELVKPLHILILAVALGALNALEAPARQAFVLEMVERKDLTNAIALNGSMFNLAMALGPAAGGLLFHYLGPAWCFGINALSFLAVIAALAAMKLKTERPAARNTKALADLVEGLRYVKTEPIIRAIIVLVAMTSICGLSFATVFPAWADKILSGGSIIYGYLVSAHGIGAFLGALFLAAVGHRGLQGRLLTVGSFAFPLCLLGFAAVRWIPLSLLMVMGIGVARVFVLNLANAMVQSQSPDCLRGRVMGVYSWIFFGSMPLGALAIGFAAKCLGEPLAVLCGAGALLLAAVSIRVLAPRLVELS